MGSRSSVEVQVLLRGYSVGSDEGGPGFCSVYLLEGQGHRVLFDCGHVGRRKALRGALAERGLAPSDVSLVVLSHAHWDHMQNADLFGHAPVLMHGDELRYLDAPRPLDHATPPWARAVLSSLDLRETGEGEALLPGVTVIDLPGHTPGSIGLTVETEDGLAVLTGDAVSTPGVLRSGSYSGVYHDVTKADASVERVLSLADVVCPGHDRPFRLATYEYLSEPAPVELRVPDPEATRAGFRLARSSRKRAMLPGLTE